MLRDSKYKKNLLFVHLMATHFPYCEVIPKDFATDFVNYDGIKMDYSVMGFHLANIKNKQGMEAAGSLMLSNDCYDRSVRYVDYVTNQLIETARTQQKPTILVYFSDHGEAPFLGTAHESRMHSHFHVEIPFLVWANDAYKQHYSTTITNLAKNTNKPGSLLDFSYYLSDIARIDGIPNTKTRSIFSKNYLPFERKTLHGKINYDVFDENADYAERSRGNIRNIKARFGTAVQSKVWAHRVNTLGSMIEAREIFPGIEMDLVFDSDKKQFFVYHPPAPNVGLTLASQLRQDDGKVHYWLDWKNANPENLQSALETLEGLNDTHNIKQRAILESGTLSKSMSIFKRAGWNTSYYLPTKIIAKCMSNCSNEEKSKLANQLLENRKKFGYGTVSVDARLLQFFDKHMAQAFNDEESKIYIWDQSIDVSDKNALSRMEKYITHKNVGVLLVNFPSPFDL